MQKFLTVLQSSLNQLEFTMGTICIHAQDYDNIMVNKDEDMIRLSIHSDNAFLYTKLTPTQAQNLIDVLQKALNS